MGALKRGGGGWNPLRNYDMHLEHHLAVARQVQDSQFEDVSILVSGLPLHSEKEFHVVYCS